MKIEGMISVYCKYLDKFEDLEIDVDVLQVCVSI